MANSPARGGAFETKMRRTIGKDSFEKQCCEIGGVSWFAPRPAILMLKHVKASDRRCLGQCCCPLVVRVATEIAIVGHVQNDSNWDVELHRDPTPSVAGYSATGDVSTINLFGVRANSGMLSSFIQVRPFTTRRRG